MLSSPVNELDRTEQLEQQRSGLEQGLKLAGGTSVVLVLLTLLFLVSNGLL